MAKPTFSMPGWPIEGINFETGQIEGINFETGQARG
jgi:hypothetical protein